MPGRRVRILLVEDRVSDAELVLHELRRAGLDPDWERVDNEPAYRAKLDASIELILADFNLPQFDAMKALTILKESGLDIPFIIVSGSIGDKAAVESMHGGAVDYIFKDNLSRLAAAAKRELAAADHRKSSTRARQESQARLSAVINSALDSVVTMDTHGCIVEWNPAAERLFGWPRQDAVGRPLAEIIVPADGGRSDPARLARFIGNLIYPDKNQRLELDLARRDGAVFPAEASFSQFRLGEQHLFSAFIRDITERRRAEKSTAAHLAVSRALSEAGSLESVLTKVLEAVGSNLGWDVGQVWLRDAADGTLRRAYRWMSPDARAAEFDAQCASARFAPGEGVVGRVWLNREPVWLEDLRAAPDFAMREAVAAAGLQSAAFAPLFAGTEVNGVVEFLSNTGRPPDPALIQLIADLSRRIGEYISRAQTEAALLESESRFRGLFYDVAVGQALVGMPDGKILAVNPAFCRLLGYQVDELLGMPVQVFADPDHAEAVRESFKLLSRDLPFYHLESRLKRKRGTTVWAELGLSATFGDGDSPRDLLIQAQDMTKRKEAEVALEEAQRQLIHRARHDALTELPNRMQLQERIQEVIGQGRALSLLVLNVDHFKDVNDSFGYLAGDDLLKQIGPRIQECARHDDIVARLGGDSFGLILAGADRQAARSIAAKIRAALEVPFSVDGHPLAVEASIGIATYPEHGATAESLMRRADIALHVAKRNPGSATTFSEEFEEAGASHLALMADLRAAIQDSSLSMYYQPLVDLKTRRVVRFEALLRWKHPVRGMVPPDQFIPFAEQTGVIQALTDWVLKTVIKQTATWQQAGHQLGVAVNISMRNLTDAGLPERIATMLHQGSSQPTADQHLLSLEVTESVLMADPNRAIEHLSKLRDLGIRLSVDDFGTGYSSLAYLSRLPVNEMKIDRSFIVGIADADDVSKAAIVRAALDLGHNLRLEVVAEGVEDARTWDLLLALGCDTAQGYHIARPMPAEAVLPWLLTSPYGGIVKSDQAA